MSFLSEILSLILEVTMEPIPRPSLCDALPAIHHNHGYVNDGGQSVTNCAYVKWFINFCERQWRHGTAPHLMTMSVYVHHLRVKNSYIIIKR